jgi:hypothetical protein
MIMSQYYIHYITYIASPNTKMFQTYKFCVSPKNGVSIFFLQCWYLSTCLHGVTTQNNMDVYNLPNTADRE